MEKQQTSLQNFLALMFFIIALMGLIMLISVAHIPVNPFTDKYMVNPPYLVGEVDTGTCIKIENFDTAFVFGRDVYYLQKTIEYDIFDVDIDSEGKTGRGVLHRYVLTQDPTLCEKLVAQERKKFNLK